LPITPVPACACAWNPQAEQAIDSRHGKGSLRSQTAGQGMARGPQQSAQKLYQRATQTQKSDHWVAAIAGRLKLD
jgi:hypothetical protein